MQRIAQLAIFLLSASAAFGQTGLATITGTITDQTGAPVANAPVVVRSSDTGTTFQGASSNTGNYTVTQLPVGDYELSVTVSGFKKYTHTNFHLAAGQTAGEDITLQVGQSTESVTVSAETSLLQTESAEVSGNFTLKQLDDLPLLTVAATNDGVRDYFAASRLLPGVQYCNSATCPTGGSGNAVTVTVINGTPNNSLTTRLDGSTMNPTSSRLGGATMETQSSSEAVQEVNILTSSFAPEFGAGLGAVVNVVTKSGTNDLHGTVYDYLVNSALNATPSYVGVKNAIHQNDYGLTVGGPVWIPKIYNGRNRTFFFFSFEEFLQNLLNTTTFSTVPIPAYRNGDFSSLITTENRLVSTASGPYVDPLGRNIPSGTIFDPASTFTAPNGALVRNPFQGNLIPVSRFDPVAVKILAMVPQPLGPTANQAGSNYLAPYNGSRRSYIPSIKIDQNLGTKLHAAFYFQKTSTSTPRTGTGADSLPDNITVSGTSGNAARTYRLNLDHTVTPTFLMHYTLGWNDSDFLLGPEAFINIQQTLGLSGATAPGRGLPLIATGVLSNVAEGGMGNLGPQYDQHFWERRPSFVTSATYVRGSHTYKAGFEIRQMKYPNFNFTYTAGEYTFGTTGTVGNLSNYTTQTSLNGTTVSSGFAGFGFASFLLGGAQAIAINAPINLQTSNYQSAIFLQDSWKLNRKLTLDYGLRWDYGTYQKEQFGRYGDFSATTPNPSASGRPGAIIYEANCNCSFAHNYPYAIGPRLGVAYQLNDKTVIRGGAGIVYGSLDSSAATGYASNAANATTPAFGQIAGLLQNGIPSTVQAAWPTLNNPAAGQAPGAVVVAPSLLDQNTGRPARLTQWNFTVQRTLGKDIAVEAGYIGNVGAWETAGALAPQNELSLSQLAALGISGANLSNPTLSSAFNTSISALTAAQKAALASVGLTQFLPYANFPQNQTVRQALLPYPQYSGTLAPLGAPLGKSWYDALQLKFTKRFSHGLTANANYTYSKTLALTSSPDPFNRGLGKNLSPYDVPHQLRISAQYEIPRFSSGIFSNKVLSYIVSGWGTGWYLNYQSAALVGLPTSSGASPISNFLGYGPGPAQLIPGMSPWSVDWYDKNGVHHTTPLNINCGCFDVTKTVVLNPAAFTNVPDGQFAANQSSIRSFRGMRYPSENANFSRNFRIKERYVLQIRAEFTNIFNRVQYAFPLGLSSPINLGNFATAPTTFTSGPYKGLYSGGFGTITPETTGAVNPRAGTIVARFTF
jgi:Carboxypeptidase regulatory-like domain/TonB dependent receptor